MLDFGLDRSLCQWNVNISKCRDHQALSTILGASAAPDALNVLLIAIYLQCIIRKRDQELQRSTHQDILLGWMTISILFRFLHLIVLTLDLEPSTHILRETYASLPWSLMLAGVASYSFHIIIALPLFNTSSGPTSPSSRRSKGQSRRLYLVYLSLLILSLVPSLVLGTLKGARWDEDDMEGWAQWDLAQKAFLCVMTGSIALIMAIGGGILITRAKARICPSDGVGSRLSLPLAAPIMDQTAMIHRSLLKFLIIQCCVIITCALLSLGLILVLTLPPHLTRSIMGQRALCGLQHFLPSLALFISLISILWTEFRGAQDFNRNQGIPVIWANREGVEGPRSRLRHTSSSYNLSSPSLDRSHGNLSTSIGTESLWQSPTVASFSIHGEEGEVSSSAMSSRSDWVPLPTTRDVPGAQSILLDLEGPPPRTTVFEHLDAVQATRLSRSGGTSPVPSRRDVNHHAEP
ncbi:hypothetical protein BJ684DRAFT_19425 [Piptocephalis cylindrospora]|uniref:Uncharacterized protein n=1 Tax=Piptocephalis cylindrospora TaxID=1907219 RepID=A0A4P9Y5C4_9FUNG|nr:hypothetical protein BJ684DRAFT_19425 [Piptocephalis cylindrospora]|eukprot:RKP14145.1 hypothetical protein BJ684DRAFT_19425 [Piptocephalis cylindrospora]